MRLISPVFLSFRVLLFSMLVCLCGAARGGPVRSPEELIRAMGDPKLTVAEHYKASGELATWGKAAIPLLIQIMDKDPRVMNPKAEVINGINPGDTFVLTVGGDAEFLLVALISNGKGNWPGSPYYGTDWPEWWRTHKDMTFEEIQKEVIARCDAAMARQMR